MLMPSVRDLRTKHNTKGTFSLARGQSSVIDHESMHNFNLWNQFDPLGIHPGMLQDHLLNLDQNKQIEPVCRCPYNITSLIEQWNLVCYCSTLWMWQIIISFFLSTAKTDNWWRDRVLWWNPAEDTPWTKGKKQTRIFSTIMLFLLYGFIKCALFAIRATLFNT